MAVSYAVQWRISAYVGALASSAAAAAAAADDDNVVQLKARYGFTRLRTRAHSVPYERGKLTPKEKKIIKKVSWC